jgi:DNA polymerase-3 subunit delta'
MPDIAPLLRGLEGRGEWLELLSMIAGGEAPQALAAIVPGDVALDFRDMYARRVLCSSGSGDDGCDSCGSWTSDGHPDLIVAGRWGEPPGISDCLDFQVQLYLKPVVAPGRLGVVSSAEGLSLPAANSLLKITEEPPAKGRILFVAERDEFITTIRSRVWMFRLLETDKSGQGVSPVSPPLTPAEWASWLERTRKFSIDELAVEAEGWVLDFCGRGEWRVAASLQNTLFLARKRHIPVSMAQDALFALLREGVGGGQIFGDLRET